MKKAAIFIALITFAVTLFSSCKSRERCPAYGKVKSPVENYKRI